MSTSARTRTEPLIPTGTWKVDPAHSSKRSAAATCSWATRSDWRSTSQRCNQVIPDPLGTVS
jgi:hypothetical protein